MPVRIAFACVAVLIGLTGGLGNGLLTASLSSIQGQLGLTQAQATWLPAAYVMVNVTANLLVFKFRQQYGMTPRQFRTEAAPLRQRENSTN